MTETILEIKNLKKSYGKNEVLKDISLSVKKGEVISIIGSSGSGKSTFLRSINLLESPSGGEILYHGDNVLEKGYDLTTYREKLGMVFQSFNLFENLNVLENAIVAQTTVLKRDRKEAESIAKANLEKVGMGEQYWKAKPKQLSGGNNDINRMPEMEERALIYDGIKHYFVVNFPQRPGALREFVNYILGPNDDITRFEYIKRANKGKGPVLIGIALSDKNDYDGLLERLSAFDPSYINLHGNETLYNMLV